MRLPYHILNYTSIGIIPALLILSFALCSCHNYDKAEASYLQARTYSENEQEAEAMSAYLHALDLLGTGNLHSAKNNILRGRIYSNIGYICGLYGDNTLAVKYFTKAGDDYSAAHDTTRYVGNLMELARIINRDSTLRHKADTLMFAALRYSTDSILTGRVLDTYSILFAERQDYYTALAYAQRALPYPAKTSETELTPYRHLQLALLYGDVGLYDSIVPHAQYVADQSVNSYYRKEALHLLSEYAKTQNQIAQALEYTHHQIKATEQSGIRSEQLQESVSILKKWEERRLFRKWFAGGITLAVALLVFILIIFIKNRHKEQQLVSQIADLQAQLNATSNVSERKVIKRRINALKSVEKFLTQHPNFYSTDEWKDNQKFATLINASFAHLLSDFDYHGLNITEQRLCVLILLGNLNNSEMADLCCISISSISKTKSRIANKLNTTVPQLRKYIIDTIEK